MKDLISAFIPSLCQRLLSPTLHHYPLQKKANKKLSYSKKTCSSIPLSPPSPLRPSAKHPYEIILNRVGKSSGNISLFASFQGSSDYRKSFKARQYPQAVSGVTTSETGDKKILQIHTHEQTPSMCTHTHSCFPKISRD